MLRRSARQGNALNRSLTWLAAALSILSGVPAVFAQGPTGERPLFVVQIDRLPSLLPSDTQLLIEPAAIETFLTSLDRSPPDWKTVYGAGHHDPGHDDRLFALNRERDAGRIGNESLGRRVTFLWSGELSAYDPTRGGFPVAVGPIFTRTGWGIVRFKPEDLPANLLAIPNPAQREILRRKADRNSSAAVYVAVTGKLIPEESIVYDFSHDEDGVGLIMPVVRVERVDYLLVP